MPRIAADETKEIPRGRWEDWCDTFSSGNGGRLMRIDVVNDEVGAEPLAVDIPLVAVDYDPTGKGNDMVISYGAEGAPSRHVIEAPVQLWQGQDANGVVAALEIEDAKGGRLVVVFL